MEAHFSRKFLTSSELRRDGYSYYKIRRLVVEGVLKQINKSTYENLAYSGEESDFLTAQAYVPGGVVCLMSAARFYGLTDHLPDAVDMAIQRKKTIKTLPEWPEIKLHYYSPARMGLGVKEYTVDNQSFLIFDAEKTVVDAVSFRNKIGVEETGRLLRAYLEHNDKDIDLIYRYAKELRCEKALRTYLEVLLV